MDWLLRKLRRISQVLWSYAAFAVLALVFACVSFLYVFRAWFHVMKSTVWETFPGRFENIRRSETSNNEEAQNPPHTVNGERAHQNLESYAALTALSSTVSFLGSLFAISNAFGSIGTTARNIAFQQVENASGSASTNENFPNLSCLAVRVGEFFAARKMILPDNRGERMPPEEHARKKINVHSSRQSSNRSLSQKREEGELDIELHSEQSPVINPEAHQEKSTLERSMKIRSSKLENTEPIRGNPRVSNRIVIRDSKIGKSSEELHRETPGCSSQLPGSARANSASASYRINEGAGPSTQSDWARREEKPQIQIPITFLDSYSSFTDRRQREESSQGSPNEWIRMQSSSLSYTRSRVDSSPSKRRLEESTGENMPGSSSRITGIDFSRKPVKQKFNLHSAKHKGVFSNAHVRSEPSETLAKEPRNNSLSAQASPSKFSKIFADSRINELSAQASRYRNVISTGERSQFSKIDVLQKPLKKSADGSPHERAVLHSSPSTLPKAHVGSSPRYKSLRDSSLSSPRTRIGFSSRKGSKGSQEECISTPVTLFQFYGTAVGLHPIEQSPEESQYERPVLQHSPEAISRIHVPSSPYEQLPEESRESPSKPESPSTLATTRVGTNSIKRPLDEELTEQRSPFKSPKTSIGSSPSKAKPEDSPEEKIRKPRSSFRFSGTDVGLCQAEQSTVESQHGRMTLQHSPVAISGSHVSSIPYEQLPQGSRHESPHKLLSPSLLMRTLVGLSPNKRSLDEDLRMECPPSKSPRTSAESSPSYKSPDKNLKLRNSTFKYRSTLDDFSSSKSPPEASREEKISIPLSPFLFSGTDVRQHAVEHSAEGSRHKRELLQHSPVEISQSHVSSNRHKQLPEGLRHKNPDEVGTPYAFSKTPISSKHKQEIILYRDSPYVFSKASLRSNPNEISEGSQHNNRILDQSSRFSQTDTCQYPIKQFAEEYQHEKALLQRSSVEVPTIHEVSMSSEESPQTSQHESHMIQIPSSSSHGTCIHEGPSKETTEIFISENRDVRSFDISEVNIHANIDNQLADKFEDTPHSMSKTSPKEDNKHFAEVLRSHEIRVSKEETTTRGKEGVGAESPAKSPIEINATVTTERNTEFMSPRFPAATTSTNEISEECNEDSPSNFRITSDILLGESEEERIQKLAMVPLRLEGLNSSEMRHSSEDSRGVLLSVLPSCEPASSETSHSPENSSGIFVSDPSCIQTSVIQVSSVIPGETLVSEEALVETKADETKTDKSN